MAKTLVFEGCPECGSVSGYGQMPLAITQKDLVTNLIQGGAIGAGTATVLDFIIPKIPVLGTLPPTIRPLLNAGVAVMASTFLYKRNPSLAIGIGIGGVAVSAYKLIAVLMGKVAAVPMSGFGQFIDEGAAPPVEIETTGSGGTGVVLPVEEEIGFNEEEILIE